MSEEKKAHPKAFISYARSSEDHKTWVRKLAEDLRQNGVDVSLDSWKVKSEKDMHVFINFSDDEQCSARLAELLRWIYDQPISSRLSLEESHEEDTPTASYARDAICAIKGNNQYSEPKLREYLEKFSNEIKKIPDLEINGALSYNIIDHIKKFIPIVNNFIDVIKVLSEYSDNIRAYRSVHRFFSDLTEYFYLSSANNYSKDIGKNFISYILFLATIAIFIREERWKALSIFFNEKYQPTEAIEHSNNNSFHDFNIFYPNEQVFWKNYWKKKDKNPSYLMAEQSYPMAAFLQANFPEGIKQSDIAQADAVIYIAHQIRKMKQNPSKVSSEYWIPECFCCLIDSNNNSSLPIFVRASSRKYFQNLLPIFDVDGVEEFTDYFNRILEESNPFSSENHGQFKYCLQTRIPTNNLGINP